MKKIVGVLFVAFLIACGSDKKVETTVDQNQLFDTYKENFINQLWENSPGWAMWVGYHKYDHILTIPNEETRKKELAFAQNHLDSLSIFSVDGLSDNNKTDFYLMENLLKGNIWTINELKSYEWDPSNYNVSGGFSNILTTDFETPEKLIITIYKEVQVMLLSLSDVIPVGIGIGAPNGNYYNGTIEYAPNLKWKGVINLIQLFRKYFDIPVYVTNDANAAAIGEMTYGVAKNSKDFVIITLGTGLGSGIVCNGQLVYGHDGFAGELGHTIVEENGRECACGRKGCLETYVSATGIVRTAHIMLAEHSKPSLLRKTSDDKITAKTIAEAAQKGDALALDIFDFTAKKLGLSLSNLVAITSPEMIVLFGGLANSGESILDPTQKYMEENLLLIFKNKIKIIPSSIKGNEAAIMGASSLVWNELKKEQLEKTSLN